MKILVLNSGSSTQKTALFDLGRDTTNDPQAPLWEGKLEWDGDQETVSIKNVSGQKLRKKGQLDSGGRKASVERLVQNLWIGTTEILSGPSEVHAIGHRIVHGGPKLSEPAMITSEVRQNIAAVASIAPLHNRAGLDGVDLCCKLFPGIPQLAVFDTGFHRTLPDEAKIYAGPY